MFNFNDGESKFTEEKILELCEELDELDELEELLEELFEALGLGELLPKENAITATDIMYDTMYMYLNKNKNIF